MKKFTLSTEYQIHLADTLTPVGVFLKIRDKFPDSILLESSDYHSSENSFSFICFDELASFEVQNHKATMMWPDKTTETHAIDKGNSAMVFLQNFMDCFDVPKVELPTLYNGLFGYCAYDAVKYFEDIYLRDRQQDSEAIPEIRYGLYQFIVAIDHYKSRMFVIQNSCGETGPRASLQEVLGLINNKNFASYPFHLQGDEISNVSDSDFVEMVKKGIEHCKKGDVFQIVLSRLFEQKFSGDEFNVYRALRSINPSPYLFYFDYGNFKLFGSSPETQIMIHKQKASIFPIAGTFRRTGNDETDADLAEKLKSDPKESAEHVMLVDLARNDLSRHTKEVEVETFKEIQYFSHVIHLVSKVSGQVENRQDVLKIVADTFPAGTLSGAPKFKAMELIDRYENRARSFYGGAIGYLGFHGDFNHAIMIRSFLSKDNRLIRRAGAGIVAQSKPESELQEVNNKLEALKKALKEAEKIGA